MTSLTSRRRRVFATGTPMELLSRITNGSFRNWLVALRDRRNQDG